MHRTWLICLMLIVAPVSLPADDIRGAVHRRGPVSAALCEDIQLLVIANRHSGSLSLFDTDAGSIVGEFSIGEQLSDVVTMPDSRTLLVTDEAKHELLIVDPLIDRISVLTRIEMPRSPVNVEVSADGRHIAVTCIWSHRVALMSVTTAKDRTFTDSPDVRVVKLPFAPRMQTFLPGRSARMVVADAFGGQLAVLNAEMATIESVRELPAHNIRGLAVSSDGERLLVSHQVLNPSARTDFEDMHWGELMQNSIRDLSLTTVLNPHASLLDDSRPIRLGQTGDAAADPAGISPMAGIRQSRIEAGPIAVALSGVNQVQMITSASHRVNVGARPLHIEWDHSQHRAYVICSLDDSISIVDMDGGPRVTNVSLGPRPDPTPRDRGERLFYDGRQSHDGWMSCHSCHTDGHTNGLRADTISDGTYGTPKQVPSLLGTRDANPWAWDGRFRELHGQVSASFKSTLQGERLSLPEVNDVVAFLHSLESPAPVDEGARTGDEMQMLERGRRLFLELGCGKCHVPPVTYTIDTTFDVGLSDEEGLRKFNPPSLRGVGQRQRFLHDGRARRLEDVFLETGHQLERGLTTSELASLVAFLNSL